MGGEVKGFELRAPPGRETRPTSDKVREAIFDVLGDAVEGARVLDLYAGSGALSIEALSRGATHAHLVEARAPACEAIRRNLVHTHMAHRAKLWCMPVGRVLSKLVDRFDLITLDPPYADRDIGKTMEVLGEGGLLADRAVVVLEHDKRFETAERYVKLRRWQRKQYGDTAVSFFDAVEEAR